MKQICTNSIGCAFCFYIDCLSIANLNLILPSIFNRSYVTFWGAEVSGGWVVAGALGGGGGCLQRMPGGAPTGGWRSHMHTWYFHRRSTVLLMYRWTVLIKKKPHHGGLVVRGTSLLSLRTRVRSRPQRPHFDACEMQGAHVLWNISEC